MSNFVSHSSIIALIVVDVSSHIHVTISELKQINTRPTSLKGIFFF